MHQKIKDYRIFSITVTLFICICLSEALSWAYSVNLDTITTQAVGLITAVLTALVGALKFCFSFAMTGDKPDK